MFSWEQRKPTHSSTVKAWSQWQNEKRSVLTQSAEALFDSYINGTLDGSAYNDCFQNKSHKQLMESALYRVFFNRSLKELERLSPVTDEMVTKTRERIATSGLPLFRLVVDVQDAPNEKQGGFHRGKKSIFLNFETIPSREWMLIFTHELAHSNDHELRRAIGIYGDKEIISSFASRIPHISSIDELPKAVQENLKKWLKAGLDRGLLAEYRAWVITAKVYLYARQKGQWPPVTWMDRFLSGLPQNPSEAQLQVHVIQKLDKTFKNPTDGIFQFEPIQKLLNTIRENLLTYH